MLELVSPVPPSLALAFAGAAPFKRKVLVHQVRVCESAAVLHHGRPVVLAMLDRSRPRRAELALAFAPGAGRHARALMRVAQLTLLRMADTGTLVFTRIAPANAQAQRLALLTGFIPGGFKDPAIWLWKERP